MCHFIVSLDELFSRARSISSPDNVIAQTKSSIIYGLGLAMTERISFKDGAGVRVRHTPFLPQRVLAALG